MLLASGAAARGQTKELVSLATIRDFHEEKCTSSEWDIILAPDSASAIEAYGYHVTQEPWECNATALPGLEGSRILRLRAVPMGVDNRILTIVQPNSRGPIWIIPITDGMVNFENIEGDQHNLAAFNALLITSHYVPNNPADWLTLSFSYLALFWEEPKIADYKIGPENLRGMASDEAMLRKRSLSPSVLCDSHGCEVTFNELYGQSLDKSYKSTRVYFAKTKDGIRISDAHWRDVFIRTKPTKH
jgi:hypothetical protein